MKTNNGSTEPVPEIEQVGEIRAPRNVVANTGFGKGEVAQGESITKLFRDRIFKSGDKTIVQMAVDRPD